MAPITTVHQRDDAKSMAIVLAPNTLPGRPLEQDLLTHYLVPDFEALLRVRLRGTIPCRLRGVQNFGFVALSRSLEVEFLSGP